VRLIGDGVTSQSLTLAPGASAQLVALAGAQVPAGTATWELTATVGGRSFSTTVSAGDILALDCVDVPVSWTDALLVTTAPGCLAGAPPGLNSLVIVTIRNDGTETYTAVATIGNLVPVGPQVVAAGADTQIVVPLSGNGLITQGGTVQVVVTRVTDGSVELVTLLVPYAEVVC
jgi:hypothetical protein